MISWRSLFTNWHLMRLVRLALGISLLVTGIRMGDPAPALFSLLFLFQAITDTGCCSSAACAAPRRVNRKIDNDIEYEEIK